MDEQTHLVHGHKTLRGRPRLQQFAQFLSNTLWCDGGNGGSVQTHGVTGYWLDVEIEAGCELDPPEHTQGILRKGQHAYLA
jgi:hypothetical protein